MLKIRCPKHPKYAAKKEPKANCYECVSLWDIKLKAQVNHLQVNPEPKPRKVATESSEV